MKTYLPWNPGQAHLLPPSPEQWLPQGHLAYFILDVVQQLDLGAIIRAVDAKDARGQKPYSPVMMVALILYAYCVGVFSSRRIERATYEDVAFRVLAGGHHPDFTRISEFRRYHLDALAQIFVQTVHLCQRAGLVKLGLFAFDGTKLEANASKHKAMSYERIQARQRQLESEIAELLARAEGTDQAEDARFGAGQREEDLPAELRRREQRLAKLRAARQALEADAARTRAIELEKLAAGNDTQAATHPDASERKRAATRAAKCRTQAVELRNRADRLDGRDGGDDRNDHDDHDDHDDQAPAAPSRDGLTSQGLETHRTPATPEGMPQPKAQYNFTDADSRIQKSGGGFLQGYNAQAMVDAESQVVVAQAVTNQQPDTNHLPPLLAQAVAHCGAPPAATVGAAGDWKPANVEVAEALGVEIYISTRRQRHDAAPPGASPAADGVGDAGARAKMEAKLQTDAGRALYARRKAVVEPVFGQIKQARGFRRFLLRGLPKVIGEWSLINATHNLLKLYRAQPQPA
jgi:transposase